MGDSCRDSYIDRWGTVVRTKLWIVCLKLAERLISSTDNTGLDEETLPETTVFYVIDVNYIDISVIT